jgi:hypothetical protein
MSLPQNVAQSKNNESAPALSENKFQKKFDCIMRQLREQSWPATHGQDFWDDAPIVKLRIGIGKEGSLGINQG